MANTTLRAALLIIGNEILSGRTREGNLQVLTRMLSQRGISLAEARVVRDNADAIVTACNELRAQYDAVFTSGGIGPTHDDITTACIAKAFKVAVIRHREAEASMRMHYTASGREATAARLRMADVPAGAELIRCTATPAPGYRIDNVYVLAGVPSIFMDMAEQIIGTLTAGPAYASRTITVHIGESEVADDLAQVQDQFPHLELGSYPQQDGNRYYTELVISGTDTDAIATAVSALTQRLLLRKVPWTAN